MKTIHTIKDITSGLKSVKLADLVKVAEKKGVALDDVIISVSDSRYTRYRDLELIVATKSKVGAESFMKEVDISSKHKKLMYGKMK